MTILVYVAEVATNAPVLVITSPKIQSCQFVSLMIMNEFDSVVFAIYHQYKQTAQYYFWFLSNGYWSHTLLIVGKLKFGSY